MVALRLPTSRELLAAYARTPSPPALRSAAIQALVALDTQAAARHAAELFADSDLEGASPTATLAAFLNRTGGAEALTAALRDRKLKPAAAKQVLRSLFATGRADQALLAAVNQSIAAAGQAPEYSEAFVRQIVGHARQQGEAVRGAAVFKSLACGACHKIGGAGGDIGPDLTAIGTTLSAERIAEELLWPNRQVKEGFSVVQVITADGKIHQGYERKTKENQATGDLVIQDLATKQLVTIKQQDIDEKQVTGSSMPAGLTSVLPRQQLLDLLSYLSELGSIK